MRKDLVLFWIFALGVALGLMALLFPFAAVPAATVARARSRALACSPSSALNPIVSSRRAKLHATPMAICV